MAIDVKKKRRPVSRSMANSHLTTNHSEIREWVEKRGGKPAIFESTESNNSVLLRINFPGFDEKNLRNISWEEFFDIFDKNNLQFLYQEETVNGRVSRFSKFVRMKGDED